MAMPMWKLTEVGPFRTFDDAMRVLDNGGRFFDLCARAADGVLTTGEVARAAGTGVTTPAVLSALFLATALADLAEDDRRRVVERLDAKLRRLRDRVRVASIAAHRFAADAEAGAGCLVEGDAEGTLRDVGIYRTGRPRIFVPSGILRPIEWTATILPDYGVARLRDGSSAHDPSCDVLVRREFAASLRGSVRVAGIAARYVFRTDRFVNAPLAGRAFLLPAYVTRLD